MLPNHATLTATDELITEISTHSLASNNAVCCFVAWHPNSDLHAGGLVFAPLMAGSKLVLPGPKLDGRSLYDLMTSQCVTCTAGVPTVWLNLLDHLRQNKLRLDHLQRLVIGAHMTALLGIATPSCTQHCWTHVLENADRRIGSLKGDDNGVHQRVRPCLCMSTCRLLPFLLLPSPA